MKKIISILIVVSLMVTFFSFNIDATYDNNFVPYVVDFEISAESFENSEDENSARVSGLITSYSLSLSKTGTTLNLTGTTHGTSEVVRSGFKNLTVQRRKSSSYDWEDYYEFGNVYVDAFAAALDTTVVVASGYQYRISCKHYAKKSLLVTQTIANTSGIVTVS